MLQTQSPPPASKNQPPGSDLFKQCGKVLVLDPRLGEEVWFLGYHLPLAHHHATQSGRQTAVARAGPTGTASCLTARVPPVHPAKCGAEGDPPHPIAATATTEMICYN